MTRLKYLTEEGKKALQEQIVFAQKDIDNAAQSWPGSGTWRAAKRYKDGLEFLLDMEEAGP